MSKCKSSLCPFEGAPDYCSRHKEKGSKTEKKVYAIPKVSHKKKSKLSEEKERKDRLKVFFDEQIEHRPDICINCDSPLIDSMWPNARTIIAHLLPKRTFHSVETHELNFVYLCAHCHNLLDLQLERSMKEFKIAHLIKERVQLLIPLLTNEELAKVSKYLL